LRAQLVAVHGNATVNPLTVDQELEALRSELVTLSGRDTANHPDVVRVKEQIAATERLKQEMETAVKSGKPEDLKESGGKPKSLADLQAISPMLQIEGEVKSNKLEIANRQQEVRDIQRQIELYQNRLNLTPVREQQLAAITRDHDQSRANYESLLNKKMQSEMATSLEKRQEGEQFRIIDPPNFPQKPYWPNRFKFSLMALAFGMLLALGLATWVETIDERIYSQKDLESVTPVPILIGIPLLATISEQERKLRSRRLQLTAAGFLMAMVSAMTLFTYYKG
jgi:polysaccharide biosynthesis transport protein